MRDCKYIILGEKSMVGSGMYGKLVMMGKNFEKLWLRCEIPDGIVISWQPDVSTI